MAVGPKKKRGNGEPVPLEIRSVGNGYSAAIAGGSTFTSTLPPERLRNDTMPSAVANRVWSRPTPTFSPAFILVPRWRTRMLPEMTFWPPKRFTPSRWPSESRPLREEPPAFLCAMTNSPVALSGDDLFDLDHRQVLAMAVLAPRVLAAPLLEDDQVRPARLLDDRGHDLGAGHALETLDRELIVGGDRVLLSTCANNGDHDDT